MGSRTALLLRLPVLTGVTLAAVVAVAAPASAVTGPSDRSATVALAVTPTLNATIRLSNCSASLVRYPTSVDTDRAMMLTRSSPSSPLARRSANSASQ